MNRKTMRAKWVTLGVLGAALFVQGSSSGQPAGGRDPSKLGAAFELPQFFVDTGTLVQAEDYYRKTLSKQLGFLYDPATGQSTITDSTMDDLLSFLGYDDRLDTLDLHLLGSQELMAKSPAGILASRFFAPKVTDVADDPPPIPTGGFGWRKLVRLKIAPTSEAGQQGVVSAFILQNIFEAEVAKDPYRSSNVSKRNQVILIRKGDDPSQFDQDRLPTYFLLYGPLVSVGQDNRPIDAKGNPIPDGGTGHVSDGKIVYDLLATFDDRDPETNLPPQSYYVPASCIQCHGGSRRRAKLNFLDTDHWYDRVTPAYGLGVPEAEDFTTLAASPYDVLYDGGRNHNLDAYGEAFAVIRTLNEEIENQNAAVDNSNRNFQRQAVEKWLQLHKTDTRHVPPYQRGFGSTLWEDTPEQRKILYYLNRYCYRCHSSINYNVFDKRAVVGRKSRMKRNTTLTFEPASDLWMPQDRALPILENDPNNQLNGIAKGDLKEFLDLLEELD